MSSDVDIFPYVLAHHHQNLATDGVAIHVTENAKIAVDTLYALPDVVKVFEVIELVYCRYEVPYSSLGGIDPSEFHDGPGELDTL